MLGVVLGLLIKDDRVVVVLGGVLEAEREVLVRRRDREVIEGLRGGLTLFLMKEALLFVLEIEREASLGFLEVRAEEFAEIV